VEKRLTEESCSSSIDINQVTNIAINQFPDAHVLEAEFAAPWQPYYVIYLAHASDADKKYGDTSVWVSSNCENVMFTSSDQGLSKIGAIAASVHSGESFGALRIPIILLIGLTTCLITITGFVMWTRKFKFLSRKKI